MSQDVQREVQIHDPNKYQPPPSSQMPSLSSIQVAIVHQAQAKHPWTEDQRVHTCLIIC